MAPLKEFISAFIWASNKLLPAYLFTAILIYSVMDYHSKGGL